MPSSTVPRQRPRVALTRTPKEASVPTNTGEPPPGRKDRTPLFRRRAVSVLARWPFRRKLNVLVVAPIAVVGVLLGIGVTGQIEQVRDTDRIAEMVRDSEQVAALINDIQAEHRLALLLSVQYEAGRPGAARPSTTAYREAQRATDERVAAVRSAFGASLPAEETQALQYIAGLDALREKLGRDYVPAANIDPAYAAAVGYLIDGIGLDRFAATSQSSVTNLLDAALRADAAHAAFESAVFSAQTRDANALTEYTRAAGAHELYTHQADRFARIATPQQVLAMDGIERGAEQNDITSQFAELQVDPGSLQSQSARELREKIAAGERQADTRLGITRALIAQTAAQADSLSANALYKAWLMLGAALLGFAAWLAFCVLVRRSVVRPLMALTGAAQQVVEAADEELARVADDESADGAPFRPQAIPVPVRDDIGVLAEAFNHVQTTAAALLERQVLSRRNVAEMFGNVGRRVSNLTTRQLSLIDAVEREETDPDLLDRLYRIDHIAVRLQRNADSLMLLAGIRETDVEARPTTLADVIRSGLGRIEGYQRVSLRSETDITVGPDITGDLTLLLAELLENAVSFSPSHTSVEVVVRPGTDVTKDGGALIEVIDHGLGMSAERLAEENARLVRRERLDLVPTKVLGLFVVGSLARHLGLRVTLSRTPGGGVTGTVWLPSTLLLTMSPVDGTPAGSAAVPTTRPGTPAVVPAPAPAVATVPERRPAIVSPHGDLPRRVPSRPGAGRAPAPEGPSSTAAARPLRRRVRGATLTVTTPAADRGAPPVRQPLDADAVRTELDEFEAAVRRAEEDAAAPPAERSATTPPDEQNAAVPPDGTGTTATPDNPRRPEGDGQ
ncbi:ATP-binding protein [Streptomyces griseiscabiei]|uniref:histidine kinase n=1 Tax=Streptomyces griseiscabiei TaxID=2993540 RepID=A0ABU4L3D8_9ACTN|nr:ATP-binding protein [Streptomyces brasiliscabiei]MBZ3901605.1 sensor histidine kinase [Streptomyces griseiscabiei]MDX2909840.1 ATP-binding protein [Streptomyces griseiscabiei]